MSFENWWNTKAACYFARLKETKADDAERLASLERACNKFAGLAYQAGCEHQDTQPRWRPIDTIPLGVKVLVYGKDYGVSQAVIYFYPENGKFNGLTHWAPLPEPPKR